MKNLKNTKPETKTPKEKSMKKPIILTVVITLLTVVAFIATFIAGMNYQNSINDHVKTEAKALSAIVKPEAPSKQ